MASLILFANDLRTKGHEPLVSALSQGTKVYGVYFFYKPAQKRFGAQRNGLLLDCLNELSRNLGGLGITFGCFASENDEDAKKIWQHFLKTHAIDNLFFNEPIEPEYCQLFSMLSQQSDVKVHRFYDQTLFEPSSFLNKGGEPYQIYTPFYMKACDELRYNPSYLFDIESPKSNGIVVDNKIILAPSWLPTEKYDQTLVSPKERDAHRQLKNFLLHDVKKYAIDRDYFSIKGTSMISPYLALGLLSIRQVLHAIFEMESSALNKNNYAHTFLKEILWREFFRYLWQSFPRIRHGKSYKSWGDTVQWSYDKEAFQKWQRGETGFPLIDAAMRNFLKTGFMHNRLRMVVASFLTKNLLIDWHEGESFFLRYLIDADLPNNNGGWQWSSSVGADAQPYFRIFNPESQSITYDKSGEFIRRELPMLKNLDDKMIHAPYKKFTVTELKNMGYHAPICDLSLTRELAIKVYKRAQSLQG